MEKIEFNEEDILEKTYSLRKTGEGGRTVLTGIPPGVIMREARRYDMTRDEVIMKLQAVTRYNSFKGLHILFELKPEYREAEEGIKEA